MDGFLVIEGFRVAVADASPTRALTARGRRGQTLKGYTFDGRRGVRRTWRFVTVVRTREEGIALLNLIEGVGHTVDFAAGLNTLTSVNPLSDYRLKLDPAAGEAVFEQDPRLIYDVALGRRWAVLWDEGGDGRHALTSSGLYVRAGRVRDDESPAGVLPSVVAGDVRIAAEEPFPRVLRRLTMTPWEPTADMLEGWTVPGEPRGAFPELRVWGDFFGNRHALALGAVDRLAWRSSSVGGTWRNNGLALEFLLDELEEGFRTGAVLGYSQAAKGAALGPSYAEALALAGDDPNTLLAHGAALGRSFTSSLTEAETSAAAYGEGSAYVEAVPEVERFASGEALGEGVGEADAFIDPEREPSGIALGQAFTQATNEANVSIPDLVGTSFAEGSAFIDPERIARGEAVGSSFASASPSTVLELFAAGAAVGVAHTDAVAGIGRRFAANLNRNGVSRLPVAFTVGGIAILPTFRHEGKDAGAGTWVAVAGSDLTETGTGTSPTPGGATPFLDDTEAVVFATGDNVFRNDASTTEGDLAVGDLLMIEYVGRMDVSEGAVLGKRSAFGSAAGWNMRRLDNRRLRLEVQIDGSVRTLNSSNGPGLGTGEFAHWVCILDLSTGEHAWYVNGGLDTSGTTSVEDGGVPGNSSARYTIGGGALKCPQAVAMAAVYITPTVGLSPAGAEMQAAVADRFARLTGVVADVARASAVPSLGRTTAATIDTILADGTRRIFRVGNRWPRLERRSNPTSRNLVANSEALDSAAWTSTGCSVSTSSAETPRGVRPNLVQATGSSGAHRVATDVETSIGSHYCVSFLARDNGDGSHLHLVSLDGTAEAWVNLTTGEVGTSSFSGAVTARSVPHWPGWIRVAVTSEADATTSSIVVGVSHADAVSAFDADTNPASAIVSAVQVEAVSDENAGPSAYAPTPYYTGYLAEFSATNLLSGSEAFDGWTAVNAGANADVEIAPDGTQTADGIWVSSSSASHHIRKAIVPSSVSRHVFSVWAKAGATDWLLMQVAGVAECYFDLGDGLVGTSANCNAGIVDYGGGWFRCWINYQGTGVGESCRFLPAESDGDPNYLGDDTTSEVFLWGAQAEAVHSDSAGPSSYVPTAGSTVTRVRDDLRFEAGENAARRGTLLATARPTDDGLPPDGVRVVDLARAGNGHTIRHVTGGAVRGSSSVGGGSSLFVDSGPVLGDHDVHSFAWSADEDRGELFVDGVSQGVDSSGSIPEAPDEIAIGWRGTAAGRTDWGGHVSGVEFTDDPTFEAVF